MNRREFNKQETIKHIKSSFILCYDAYGLDKININQLCEQCKVAKSTFYQYFPDKYSVLEEIEEELIDGLVKIFFTKGKRIDLSFLSKNEPVPEALDVIHFLAQNRNAFKALLGSNGDPSFITKWHKYIVRSYDELFQNKKQDTKQRKVAASLFASSLIELYRFYLSDKPRLSDRECALMAGDLLKCFLYDFGREEVSL